MASVDSLSNLFINQTNINQSVKNVNNLSSVINNMSSNVIDLSNHLLDLSTTNNVFLCLGDSIDQMNDSLTTSNDATEKAGSKFGKLGKLAKNALSFINFDNIKKGTEAVDQYINTSNGLSRVNDGLQSQSELLGKVNAAASRSGLSYTDMAKAVTEMGTLDTFGSNDETIAFAELMQKSIKADGSDKSLSDVSGAMSDGMIQGEEFSSLTGDNPIISNALSSYTGKSGEQLQEMADQGLITANLLKTAMFASGDEISAKYNEVPKTFADVWTKIKNSASNALNPIMQLVSDILNNPSVQAGINLIVASLSFVSQVISNLIGFITDNWSFIEPILIAIGSYLTYFGAKALVELVKSLYGVLVTEWATLAPLLAIIATIALVVYFLQSMGVSFEDIFGFIGGVVGAAIAGIWNLFLGLFDFILGILSFLINPFIAFANFLGNIFTNPVSSILHLFQDMADNVLGIIQTIASAMDKVLGSSMADAVQGWRDGLKDKTDDAVKKYAPDENYESILDTQHWNSDDLGLHRMDYSETYQGGKNLGKSLYGAIADKLSSLGKSEEGYDFNEFNTKDDALGTSNNPTSVKGTGSGGSVGVSMEEEDLSYLRSMAERDYIANVATNTLAPNIAVSFGDVHETADVNQLYGRIQTILKEQIAVAPEGVY